MNNFKSFCLDIREYGYLSQKDKYGTVYAEEKGNDYVEGVVLAIYFNVIFIITILIPFLLDITVPNYIIKFLKSNFFLQLVLALVVISPYLLVVRFFIKPLLANNPINRNSESYSRKRNKFWISILISIIFPLLMFAILNILRFGKINP